MRNLLRTAEMDGSLRLTVYPQSLRPLNKRSERTLSTMNLGNTKTNTTLSSSMGDLPLSTLRSRHEWNFEEEVVLQQLPDPLVEPTNPLPRRIFNFFTGKTIYSQQSFRGMPIGKESSVPWLRFSIDGKRIRGYTDRRGSQSE